MIVKDKYTIEPFMIDFEVYFTDNPRSLAEKLIKQNPSPQVSDELKRDWINDEGAGASIAAGMMGLKMDTFGVVAIFDSTLIGEHTAAYFAHEAMHVLSYIQNWTGVKLDPNNDEWQAYMIDYLVRLITKTYSKVK